MRFPTPRITDASNSCRYAAAKRSRSVSAARASTEKAEPTTSQGTAMNTSDTRYESPKYPVSSAVASNDIITIATR